MNDPRISMAFNNAAQMPIAYGRNAQGEDVKLSETEVQQRNQQLVPIETKITDAQNRMKANEGYLKLPKNHKRGRALKAEYDKAKKELDAANAQKEQIMVRYRYKVGVAINVPLFKAKLKNMVRQVRDYPELKYKYNGINVQWNQENGNQRDITNEDVMAVTPSAGGRETATIHYDAYVDRDTPEAQQERTRTNLALSRSIGHLDKVGNHEQGHILESTLNPMVEDQNKGTASNYILQSVLPKVLNQQDLQRVKYAQQDGKNAKGKSIFQGQVDTTSDIIKTKKLTSGYGQTNSKEFFAEAFHDVYTKGVDAKDTSKEIVKEYERRSTAKQKGEFQKKERGWFTRFKRWVSKKFNYGATHDAQPGAPSPDLNDINIDPNNIWELPQADAAQLDPNAGQPVQGEMDVSQIPLPGKPEQVAKEDQDLIAEAPRKKKLKKKKK